MINTIKTIVQIIFILLSFPTLYFYELCKDLLTGVCQFKNVKYSKGRLYKFEKQEAVILSTGIAFWILVIVSGFYLF